jgi:hypothetical protein
MLLVYQRFDQIMTRHVLFMDEPFHQLMLAQQFDDLLQYLLQAFLNPGFFNF